MGYGKTQTTELAKYLQTYYFRKSVTLDQVPTSVTMDYVIDDAFIIYVNGKEAGRYNLPNSGVTYNTNASTYAINNPNSGTMTLDASLFRKGSNVIAVEVHNFLNPSSTDILWQAAISITTEGSEAYLSTDREYTLPTSGSINLTAVWEQYPDEIDQRINRATPIRINEVSAGNTMSVNDLFKKADWVELYNTTDTDLDVTGLYISDKNDNPTKYQITGGENINTIIPAKGYLVIWCDNKVAEAVSQLHANFKLGNKVVENPYDQLVMISSSEEFVANNQDYFDAHEIMKEFTDTLFYGQHGGEQTVGRYPDGSMTYYVLDHPTPAASNMVEVTDPFAGYDKLWIYDGPVSLRGDVNNDGIVNGTDIQEIINLIVASKYYDRADINNDGVVNGTDIQEIINIIITQ